MKKLLLLCAGMLLTVKAFSLSPSCPFDVGYSSAWCKGYPIVTDTFGELFFDKVDCYAQLSDSVRWVPKNPLIPGDVITAINGTDVENMKDLQSLCNRDTLVLNTYRKTDGHNMHMKCTIVKKNKGLCILPFDRHRNKPPKGIKILSDSDVDFANFDTYDFLIAGNDPLTDKKILEKFVESALLFRMRRDTENPDVLITVSKNADESISQTYIPPQTINTGSNTYSYRNYLTGGTNYVTRQNTWTTQGYTQTDTNTNIYLEISILDAKKMQDPNQLTAPIIWQMTFSRNVTNRNFEILDEYLAIASWNCYPFSSPYCTQSLKYKTSYVGAEFDNNGVVSYIRPDTPAYELGLQKGDKIIKIDNKKTITLRYNNKKAYKYKLPYGMENAIHYYGTNSWSSNILGNNYFTVLRDRKKIILHGYLIRTDTTGRETILDLAE